MKLSSKLLFASVLWVFVACTATEEKADTSQSSGAGFESVMAEAKSEYDKADKAGFAWRDTEDLIKKAEQANKDGDADKAMKLAQQAKRQALNALEQAARESNAGPRL